MLLLTAAAVLVNRREGAGLGVEPRLPGGVGPRGCAEGVRELGFDLSLIHI